MGLLGFLKPNVAKMKKERDINGLARALKHKDEAVRREAARALGDVQTVSAVEPLLQALTTDESADVRAAVIEALAALGEPAVQGLLQALKEPGAAGRFGVVHALGGIGEPAVMPTIEALTGEDTDFQRGLRNVLAELGEVVREPLIHALEHPSPVVRAAVAGVLPRVAKEQALEPLISALQDGDSMVRRSAVDALASGTTGGLLTRRAVDRARALEPLIGALQDSDPTVRQAAVEALPIVVLKEAVEPLIGALQDSNPMVRRSAVSALSGISDWRILQPLKGAMADSDESVRTCAERALERILSTNNYLWAQDLRERKDYRSLAAIFNNTTDPQRFNKRSYADDALEEAGSEAVDIVLEGLARDDVGRAELAKLLVNIGDTKAVPLLKRMLDRGCFDAYGPKAIRAFVDQHPELHGEVETDQCKLCGKTRPVIEMKYGFCADTCWRQRGRVLGSTLPGAKSCPFYSEGTCTVNAADGDTTPCSLEFGSYSTTCHVYRIGMTRRF